MPVDQLKPYESHEQVGQRNTPLTPQEHREQKIAHTNKQLQAIENKKEHRASIEKKLQKELQHNEEEAAKLRQDITSLKSSEVYTELNHLAERIAKQKKKLDGIKNPKIREKRKQSLQKKEERLRERLRKKHPQEMEKVDTDLASLEEELALVQTENENNQKALQDSANQFRSLTRQEKDARRDLARYEENLQIVNENKRESEREITNNTEKIPANNATLERQGNDYTITLGSEIVDGKPVTIAIHKERRNFGNYKNTLVYEIYNKEGKFIKLPEIYPQQSKRLSYQTHGNSKFYDIQLLWDENNELIDAVYEDGVG